MKQVVVVLLFLLSSVYVTGVYSNWGFPFDIPDLVELATPAFGTGISPLLAVSASAAKNLARDQTGALVLIQKIIVNVTEPLNTLLDTLKNCYNTNEPSQTEIRSILYSLIDRTARAAGLFYDEFGNARTYADELSTKISASVYDAIDRAITVLTNSIYSPFNVEMNLHQLVDKMYDAFLQSFISKSPVTQATISNFVTPNLVRYHPRVIANITSAIDTLAKSLENAVTEINYSLIDPVISQKLPNIIQPLVSFNSSADSTRASVTQAAKSIASSVNSTFNTITSNSFDWNNGNIANLTTFLANFTTLVQSTLMKPFDSGIDQLKTNVNKSVTNQVTQVAQAFTKVYINISDTTSSNALAQACVTRYNASLLSTLASILRLGDCIQLESNSFSVIRTHAREAFSKVKDHAIRSMNHLQLCKSKNGACVEKLFASFNNRYQRAVKFLTLVGGYSTVSLMAIGGRIADCMTAIGADIEMQVQTIQDNFNGCLAQCCGTGGGTIVIRTYLPQYFYQWVLV